MKVRVFASIFAAAFVLACIYIFTPDICVIPDYFAKNIRASLFTGLLTMGSFLFSLQAFIVVKLKENVFDSAVYRERLEIRRKLNPKISLYGPVKRLSTMLFISAASAIFASICQLTFGLIQHWIATFFCVFAATFAICMLLAALLLIKSALSDWLDSLEDHNNKQNKLESTK